MPTTASRQVKSATACGRMRAAVHDLRHSYATWLVSAGVPINDVQRIMGHEQAATTLDLYTHGSPDRDERVRGVFADFLLTAPPNDGPGDAESPSEDGL